LFDSISSGSPSVVTAIITWNTDGSVTASGNNAGGRSITGLPAAWFSGFGPPGAHYIRASLINGRAAGTEYTGTLGPGDEGVIASAASYPETWTLIDGSTNSRISQIVSTANPGFNDIETAWNVEIGSSPSGPALISGVVNFSTFVVSSGGGPIP
jgi:hypothetical protein